MIRRWHLTDEEKLLVAGLVILITVWSALVAGLIRWKVDSLGQWRTMPLSSGWNVPVQEIDLKTHS